MAPLIRKTTTHIVADELRKRILTGQLHEGEQIRQEAIAKDLGVSRIPVREALRQLEVEGLITLVSHKGAEVTRLEPSEIAELFEVRELLECRLFELAIGNMSNDALAKAEALIAKMQDGAAIEDWGTLNWQFHETLYRDASRPATMRILRRVHDNIDRYVRLQITLTDDAQTRAHNEHRALIDAAKAGDAEKGTKLLAAHINHVRDQLLQSLTS